MCRTEPPASEPSSSSLDPTETSEHPLKRQSQWQCRMHAKAARTRQLIVDALWTQGDDRLRRRATRMGMCCWSPTIGELTDGSPAVGLGRCRDRMCPTCAGIRGKRTAAVIAAEVGHWSSCRFVTLTLRSTDAPLAGQVKRLIESFKALRRREFWRDRCTNGIAVIEVTWHTGTGQWHPHLHVLVQGDYLPQAQLSAEWKAVTGDSMIVDVRAVHDRADVVGYVVRYLAKPAGVEQWPPQVIADYAVGMKGVRMLNSFGTKRKLPDSDVTRDERPVYVRPLISLSELDLLRQGGVGPAEHALEILERSGWPYNVLLRERGPNDRPVSVPLHPEELNRVVALIREVLRITGTHTDEPKPVKQHVDRQAMLFQQWAT